MGPASIDLIGKLLWYGARVRAEYDSQYGHIQSRAAPSAGGLQCADIIVSRVDEIPGVHLYDPISHALCEVYPYRPEQVTQYHAEIMEAFPEATGCVITLLADHEKADAKYHNAESLLLRDSGALMVTLQLCATALGCDFCFAGNLGTTLNRAIITRPEVRIAVGSGVFGTRIGQG
jgi:SagB-type dehydrogenase family enzyme